MSSNAFPKDYQSGLDLYDTQVAIKRVKDFFQTLLAEQFFDSAFLWQHNGCAPFVFCNGLGKRLRAVPIHTAASRKE